MSIGCSASASTRPIGSFDEWPASITCSSSARFSSPRMVIRMVRAPYGDFRDWPAIAKWGREIAGSVVEVAAIER